MAARRRSLLEDESVIEIKGREGRDEASEGDICGECGHSRGKHLDDGPCLKCGKCDQFEE